MHSFLSSSPLSLSLSPTHSLTHLLTHLCTVTYSIKQSIIHSQVNHSIFDSNNLARNLKPPLCSNLNLSGSGMPFRDDPLVHFSRQLQFMSSTTKSEHNVKRWQAYTNDHWLDISASVPCTYCWLRENKYLKQNWLPAFWGKKIQKHTKVWNRTLFILTIFEEILFSKLRTIQKQTIIIFCQLDSCGRKRCPLSYPVLFCLIKKRSFWPFVCFWVCVRLTFELQ